MRRQAVAPFMRRGVLVLRKQEFYEGAALHVLAQSGCKVSISHAAPFFLINDGTLVLLKYSTRGRSPWGFTFTPKEQSSLAERADSIKTVIGMVCGSDGVAALSYEMFREIAAPRGSSLHI